VASFRKIFYCLKVFLFLNKSFHIFWIDLGLHLTSITWRPCREQLFTKLSGTSKEVGNYFIRRKKKKRSRNYFIRQNKKKKRGRNYFIRRKKKKKRSCNYFIRRNKNKKKKRSRNCFIRRKKKKKKKSRRNYFISCVVDVGSALILSIEEWKERKTFLPSFRLLSSERKKHACSFKWTWELSKKARSRKIMFESKFTHTRIHIHTHTHIQPHTHIQTHTRTCT